MNPEVKAKWVTALRSGRIRQGHGYLRVGERYCCLGVLSELAVNAGVVERFHDKRSNMYTYGDSDEQVGGYLHGKVQAWADLPFIPHVRNGTLSGLNDGGMSFPQIADLIERDL